jgi:hypothetical protein
MGAISRYQKATFSEACDRTGAHLLQAVLVNMHYHVQIYLENDEEHTESIL